jgi:HSP20 family protein
MPTWDPFEGIESLHRQIDQAFERQGTQFPPMFRAAFLPGRAAREYPLINLYDDQDSVYVEALAPGADPSSFNISVAGDTLTLSGEKRRAASEVNPEAFHREERAAGKFIRTVELPAEVDDGKVKGEYKNGLLLVTLPKAAKAKPRQIPVQIA